MRSVEVQNVRSGRLLGDRIEVADVWWRRLRGLVGRGMLLEGQGLLLSPCRGVHMYGMKHGLDVAVLRADGTVIARYPGLPPSGRTSWYRDAAHVLEVPTGVLDATDTVDGDRLAWDR